MEVRDYEELKKDLCKELEEVKSSKKMGMAEIEIIDKLTHSIKSIDRIIESMGGSEYSGTYYSGANNGMNSRASYANRRGTHYVRGHYSMADRMMDDGRYSYAAGMDEIIDRMDAMINDPSTSMEEKNMMRKAMNMLQH